MMIFTRRQSVERAELEGFATIHARRSTEKDWRTEVIFARSPRLLEFAGQRFPASARKSTQTSVRGPLM